MTIQAGDAELRKRCVWLCKASGPPVRCWLLWQSTEHGSCDLLRQESSRQPVEAGLQQTLCANAPHRHTSTKLMHQSAAHLFESLKEVNIRPLFPYAVHGSVCVCLHSPVPCARGPRQQTIEAWRPLHRLMPGQV